MTVRIVTDSACDLPQSVADELKVTIVPLSIRFGDDEFIDRRDLTASEFWAKSAESAVLPETAAPSPGLFEEAYRAAIADGATGIVVVNLSGGLSATIQSAELGVARRRRRGRASPSSTANPARWASASIVAATARAAAAGASFDEVHRAGDQTSRSARRCGARSTRSRT